MGQLVLAGAGAVVGSMFGMPGLGWAIGSLIGGAVFAPTIRTHGPRLSDLQVQLSSYGTPLPIDMGTIRHAGVPIWMSTIREVTRTEEIGGKGGPTQEVTTYSYYCDFAVAICDCPDGPIVGLQKIFADQKLIYDTSSTTNADAIALSVDQADAVVLYTGSETQQPDPTMQAALGVNDTPAFRGTAYVVFRNYDLTPTGGRLPNITFVVVADGTRTYAPRVTRQIVSSDSLPSGRVMIRRSGRTVRLIVDGTDVVGVLPFAGTTVVQTSRDEVDAMYPANAADSEYAFMMRTPEGTYIFGAPGTSGDAGQPDNATTRRRLFTAAFDGSSGTWKIASLIDTVPFRGSKYIVCQWPCVDGIHVRWMIADYSGGQSLNFETVLLRWTGLAFVEVEREMLSIIDAGGNPVSFAFAGLLPTAGIASAYTSANFYGAMMESDLEHVWQTTSAINQQTQVMRFQRGQGLLQTLKRWSYSGAADSFVTEIVSGSQPAASGSVAIWADDGIAVTARSHSSGWLYEMWTRLDAGAAGSVTASNAVRRLTRAAGLADAEVDVTDLATLSVRGYTFTGYGPARRGIEQLAVALNFDAVESDGKIKFVRRDAAASSAATIPSVDLGAGSEGELVDEVQSERGQEDEIPARVDLTYLALNNDYQPGAYTAQRSQVASEQASAIELPVALTDDEAAAIAQRVLYEAWVGRTQRTLRTTAKYLRLEPTDRVEVKTSVASYKLRLIERTERGPLLEFKAVDEVGTVWNQASRVGAGASGGSATLQTTPPSDVLLLDVPLLRDADDAASAAFVYAAAYPLFTTGYAPWPGARLYLGTDGEALEASIGLPNRSIVGTVVTPPVPWGITLSGDTRFRGFFLDSISRVVVQLPSDQSLTSCTFDELLDAATNAALVGREIVKFMNATSLGGGQWALTGLLRGLKGTEHWAKYTQLTRPPDGEAAGIPYRLGADGLTRTPVYGHWIGEPFVMLNPAALSGLTAGGLLFATTRYKAVTAAQPQDTGSIRNTVLRGFSKIIPPPVHLHAAKATNGDITFTWVRRGRINAKWQDSMDVPLGETVEAYAIELIFDTSKKKIYTVTGQQSFTWTAAMQAADGAALTGNEVRFRVLQIPSDVVGGYDAATDPAYWSELVRWDFDNPFNEG